VQLFWSPLCRQNHWSAAETVTENKTR
jgi:hypothetical protein